ncbi:la domain-containing protein [Ditylenchus destructor]|nr:la domain-containing protein [Ditylenchus destructor]
MATTPFICQECQMGFDEYSDVKQHLSLMHLDCFPYKCFTCRAKGIKYETISSELMQEHTSSVHQGREPDVRFSTTEENELKIGIENCRRPSAEQTPQNDSKLILPQVFISLGSTLTDSETDTGTLYCDSETGTTENGVTTTEMRHDISNFEVTARTNDNNVGTNNETAMLPPATVSSRDDESHTNTELQGNTDDAHLTMMEENQLSIFIKNGCQSNEQPFPVEQISENDSKDAVRKVFISLGTALADPGTILLADTGNDTAENEVTSTEIVGFSTNIQTSRDSKEHLRSISLGITAADTGNGDIEKVIASTKIKQEVHVGTVTDNIGTTNEGLTHDIQPENGSSRGDELKMNVTLLENTEVIESIIPHASSIGPVVIAETNQSSDHVISPIKNSENGTTPNVVAEIKTEPAGNATVVPVGLRLQMALSAFVPIDVDEDEDQCISVPKKALPKPSVPCKKRSRNELSDDSQLKAKRVRGPKKSLPQVNIATVKSEATANVAPACTATQSTPVPEQPTPAKRRGRPPKKSLTSSPHVNFCPFVSMTGIDAKSVNTATLSVPFSVEKAKRIIEQVEFYFGDINLPGDKFLQREMKKDFGWIQLTVMLTFKRLANITKNAGEIATALQNSSLIQVSDDKNKIRRSPDNPAPVRDWKYWQEIRSRTVYVNGFPQTTTLDEIIQFINQHGKAQRVKMQFTNTFPKVFDGSVFVTFETKETAEKFASNGTIKVYNGWPIFKQMQEVYIQKMNHAKKVEQLKQNLATMNFVKGLILKVTGLPDNSETLEFMKLFIIFGDIVYVIRGGNTAVLRF